MVPVWKSALKVLSHLKNKSIEGRWFICREEMEQALLGEVVREQEEVGEEVVAEAGWEAPDLALVPAASVYAPPAELLCLIK